MTRTAAVSSRTAAPPQEPPAGRDALRLRRLQKGLGLTQVELARILETSPSTLARRALTASELDRVGILEQLARLAAQIVPREQLARWLAEEKIPLEGATPKDLLASESGRRRLETYLLRALDGTAF
jgi:transcriptional regulator with XRE-family HTH domain